MIGAIIGDIVGSRFEADNYKAKDFDLFDPGCIPTDDSVMSLAVANAILDCAGNYRDLSARAVTFMQMLGRKYKYAGYGGRFIEWIWSEDPQPYYSYGNGAGMRVGPCGFAAATLDEAKQLSYLVTSVTHNHPDGIKGAEAIATAVFLARTGKTKSEIRDYIQENYYDLSFTLDEIRYSYHFDVSCQGSVDVALEAFFESADFEDAIRNAISVGGDSDTIGAMTGAVAEAYYGVPKEMILAAADFLDDRLLGILYNFEKRYPSKALDDSGEGLTVFGVLDSYIRAH